MYNIVLKALKNITQHRVQCLTKPSTGHIFKKFTIYSVHNILVEQRNTSKSHVKATKQKRKRKTKTKRFKDDVGTHPQFKHSKYFLFSLKYLHRSLSICFGFFFFLFFSDVVV